MAELPKSLEDAIVQSRLATQTALADGLTLLQVELLFPEIKVMPVAVQFIPALDHFGAQLKIFFPDAGAAALARRDWGEIPYKIMDIGTSKTGVEKKIQPEDEAFLLISPTAVEVVQVEQIANAVGVRPLIMLNPRLEDSGTVGIGYAARQTRTRFISTIESCYYLRPVDDETALFRCYPEPWQVWVEKEGDYQKIAELPKKPSGDELDEILMKPGVAPGKKPGVFVGLQRFLRALSN